jgi:surface antigen
VALLRAKAGNPIPSNLGNASTWAIRAAAMGLPTGTTPQVGAAVVTKTSGEGHVAYVTAVNDDGSITVSEMNHNGWNRVDSRTLSGNFHYIY